MNIMEDWGRLYTMDGQYLRYATEKEWRESYTMNMRYNMMGYIPITSANDGGEVAIVYACVIGGPTRGNDI
jgi:hypothetical protein